VCCTSAVCAAQTPALEAAPTGAPAATPSTPEGKPRLFVTDLATVGVAREEAAAMTDALIDALSRRGLFAVTSARDLQTLLSAERQRQLLGACAEEASCGSEASALLNARFVVSGQLSKVGSAYQLALQMVDTEKSRAVARSSRLAPSLKALLESLPYLASEATGTPLPPPPTRWWQVTLISAGGAAVLAGGVLGGLALSRQAVLNDELCPSGEAPGARCAGVALRPRAYYLEQDAQLGTQKTAALVLMSAGLALGIAGVVLLPAPEGGPRLAARLVPTSNGAAVVGAFW
jgi:TolB-like protein